MINPICLNPMRHPVSRRRFLYHSGLFALSSLGTLGLEGCWLARSQAAATNPPVNTQRLVVIFLRGAVDGLNVVVPYRAEAYYSARPNIAIPQPGATNGALDLDGQFGLHPELAMLLPLWQDKSLAFVHACGSPDPTRSHFDAQDYMESGTPGRKSTRDGWMNRLLATLVPAEQQQPQQALSIRQTTPRILQGSRPVANLPLGDGGLRRTTLDQPQVRSAFDRLYAGSTGLDRAYQAGKASREQLLTALEANREMTAANNGAPVTGFTQNAQRLGQLMARDPGIRLAFLDLGGWDTHVNQPAQLSRQLRGLGQGLDSLVKALGTIYKQTAIVVLSEFGRTFRENGNRGTDHGHGNVLWLLGGSVQGGRVQGTWPGLDPNQLREGRELAITTDFRAVLSTVLRQHLQLSTPALAKVFPDYSPGQTLSLFAETPTQPGQG